MANFFISDLHIGHANVIRFDQRPFANLSEMHEATGIALDGGRFFTVVPDYEYINSQKSGKDVCFRAYSADTLDFTLYEFISKKHPEMEAKSSERRLMECVPMFFSIQEKQAFLEYASDN